MSLHILIRTEKKWWWLFPCWLTTTTHSIDDRHDLLTFLYLDSLFFHAIPGILSQEVCWFCNCSRALHLTPSHELVLGPIIVDRSSRNWRYDHELINITDIGYSCIFIVYPYQYTHFASSSSIQKMSGGLGQRPLSEVSPMAQRRNSPSWNQATKVNRETHLEPHCRLMRQKADHT